MRGNSRGRHLHKSGSTLLRTRHGGSPQRRRRVWKVPEEYVNKQRVNHVDPATVNDPAMLDEFAHCAGDGALRPESRD
jgi:hypothetical protein